MSLPPPFLCLLLVVASLSTLMAQEPVRDTRPSTPLIEAKTSFNHEALEQWLPLVTVDDPGNRADSLTGKGAVAEVFSIGKYDVTANQYCDFLNAVASESDLYHLYDPRMETDPISRCIARTTKDEGGYTYSIIEDRGQLPITYVNLYSAARFCNWMQAGGPLVEGNRITEMGAYYLEGMMEGPLTRTLGALYFIPTEDELYKSAYYKRGSLEAGYYRYPNRCDFAPSNHVYNQSSNEANYQCLYDDIGSGLTAVGLYWKSQSPYDAFDTGGNVAQWSSSDKQNEEGALLYVIRGGSWKSSYSSFFENDLQSISSQAVKATEANNALGFRVASSWISGQPSEPTLVPPVDIVSNVEIAALGAATVFGIIKMIGCFHRENLARQEGIIFTADSLEADRYVSQNGPETPRTFNKSSSSSTSGRLIHDRNNMDHLDLSTLNSLEGGNVGNFQYKTPEKQASNRKVPTPVIEPPTLQNQFDNPLIASLIKNKKFMAAVQKWKGASPGKPGLLVVPAAFSATAIEGPSSEASKNWEVTLQELQKRFLQEKKPALNVAQQLDFQNKVTSPDLVKGAQATKKVYFEAGDLTTPSKSAPVISSSVITPLSGQKAMSPRDQAVLALKRALKIPEKEENEIGLEEKKRSSLVSKAQEIIIQEELKEKGGTIKAPPSLEALHDQSKLKILKQFCQEEQEASLRADTPHSKENIERLWAEYKNFLQQDPVYETEIESLEKAIQDLSTSLEKIETVSFEHKDKKAVTLSYNNSLTTIQNAYNSISGALGGFINARGIVSAEKNQEYIKRITTWAEASARETKVQVGISYFTFQAQLTKSASKNVLETMIYAQKAEVLFQKLKHGEEIVTPQKKAAVQKKSSSSQKGARKKSKSPQGKKR